MACSCCQPGVNVTISVGDLVAALTGMENRLMARLDEVMTKITELTAATVELAKDVQRLIAEGDTTAAVAGLQAVIDNLGAIDASVETASPEPPAPEPTPEPTPEPAPEPAPAPEEPPAEPV